MYRAVVFLGLAAMAAFPMPSRAEEPVDLDMINRIREEGFHRSQVMETAYHLTEVIGRSQHGEEEQDPEPFAKDALMFLSGEPLPRCWTDPHYRDEEIQRY